MKRVIARSFYKLVGTHTIPVTLGLRNIYILPTRYGFLFLLVLVAMLIGSINYNNNLGFLLTFLLGSLMLTAMMHTYSMLFGLRLLSAAAPPVFAGQTVMVAIRADGAGRQRNGIRWYFNPDAIEAADLAVDQTAPIGVPLPTSHRGPLEPGWLRIFSEYPIGLFRAWARIETGLTCLVYPRPISAPAPVGLAASDHGEGESISAEGVEDFQGLSAYQPGDPPRRIHWQSYSRGRGLHVKAFGGQTGTDWMLDLDAIVAGDLESKLSMLCFQLLQGHRQRCRVALKLGVVAIPAGRGRSHRDRCLRALALYRRS